VTLFALCWLSAACGRGIAAGIGVLSISMALVRLGCWRIICTCRFWCRILATMLGLGLGIDYAC